MDGERVTLATRRGLHDQAAELQRLAVQIAELEDLPLSVVTERIKRALDEDLREHPAKTGP